MKKLLISAYSKPLRNGKYNSKNYPYWKELVNLLNKNYHLIQIYQGNEEKLNTKDHLHNLKIKDIETLIDNIDFWISVDNFLPHMVNCVNKKPGVVLFSKSDPIIFGYDYNLNILKDRKYLRNLQYDIWETEEFDPNSYLQPEEVEKLINQRFLS